MGNFLALIGRFGPLVAALGVGLGGLLTVVAPGAKPIVDAFVAFLGFFGATPDAVFTAEIASIVASLFLVYGSVRKLINLVKAI